MSSLLRIAVLAGIAFWIVNLQRSLRAAQLRGDMYRDIAARLDRRVAELSQGSVH